MAIRLETPEIAKRGDKHCEGGMHTIASVDLLIEGGGAEQTLRGGHKHCEGGVHTIASLDLLVE